MIAIKFYIMDESLRGVVGIQNMGNTCYCNSTIQILRACHEWNVFCITQDFSHLKDNNNKKILLAYQDIIKSIWSASKPSYIRPTGFLSEIRKVVKGTVYEMFGQTIPNDSHEFLIYLLDNFHEALKEELYAIRYIVQIVKIIHINRKYLIHLKSHVTEIRLKIGFKTK